MPNPRTPGETVIVGGGLAGLAAAVALTEHGLPVTLLESRKRLGGRASSFEDPATGETLDNCQHVSMGCCTNLRHFCRIVGTEHLFHAAEELAFVGPDGGFSRLWASPYPAPLHLWPALRRLSFLTLAERRRLLRGLAALARSEPETLQGLAFDEWLKHQQQDPHVIERFWQVVLVSALSESLDRIDAAMARKVFVDSFIAHRDGWRVLIPAAPLDEIFGERVRTWLDDRGASVRLNAAAGDLCGDPATVRSVRLRNGESIAGDEFILATPHWRVRDLLPPDVRHDERLRGIANLETAPISSVHLWFDRPVTDLPHAVLVGRLSQWMFNRNRLWQRDACADGHCYQIVISASRSLDSMTRDEIIAAVLDELAEVWPQVRTARLLKSRLVTERRSVFSPTPGCDRLRPLQQSPIANLQLAGDWTRTGWPSTMEGAVRSGYLAAENVLRRLGRPRRLLQPDLPPAVLSRWLFGLRPVPDSEAPARG